MIRSPKNGFFDDPLSKNGFFDYPFSKNGFFDDPFSKKVFPKRVSARRLSKRFGKNKNLFKKSIQKSISKNQGQKSSQKKLGQKAKPSPTKNRFKFQNNNPKNGAARGARRPIFGASARGASVVVLNFVSVFCKGLQELLAQLFFWPGFFV